MKENSKDLSSEAEPLLILVQTYTFSVSSSKTEKIIQAEE